MRTLKIPKGFLFSVAEAAIKKPGRKDLGLIYSDTEAVAAGMFTTNRVKAAPVRLDMQRIRSGRGRAIVVNSGNANACTGREGMKDALEMAALPARALGLPQNQVFVCSTGVIGTPMPMDRIRASMDTLTGGLGSCDFGDVARAIMTTDTFPKTSSREIVVGGRRVTISACAKGAGMIAPNMATMLCFIITDAVIGRQTLRKALAEAVGASFNRITIDGDMSTNDTVLMLANGAAWNTPITSGAPLKAFSRTLRDIVYELSTMIVRDGEGAQKLVEIEVCGARSSADAERAARTIANSLLVKTALYGNDANWGRIMAALGYSGIFFKEEKVDISLGRLRIVRHGLTCHKDREANKLLRRNAITIEINLHLGKGCAKVMTCDLSEAYVKINAEYRT